jgi:creatinine amidohydrolase
MRGARASERPERSRTALGVGAKRRLAFMTWEEVDAALRGGCNRIVVPFGAVEQHGRHLPLDTDAVLGDHLGPLLAQRLNALCAPTVRVGCSEQHMGRAGTLSIRPETLRLIVHDIVESLARHRFRTIVLLPTHAGNAMPLADAARTAQRLSGVRVVTVADLGALASALQRATGHDASNGTIVHAGEIETSLLRALDPGAVRDPALGSAIDGLAYVMAFVDECIRQLEEQGVRTCSYA